MNKGIIFEGELPDIGNISVRISPDGAEEIVFGHIKRGPEERKDALNKPLRDYFDRLLKGKGPGFPYNLNLRGTAFQKSVWKAIREIPYGEIKTYGQIAVKVGKPTAFRAVGSACGANRLPLVIPCHRVVASKGLGGFSSGTGIKKQLLRLEGIDPENL